MKAVVIYESMYGNTHRIASAIAAGFRRHGEAVVVPVGAANAALIKPPHAGTEGFAIVGLRHIECI
jgi:menaquinone-dependent protoporphyrinogen IX oxidase